MHRLRTALPIAAAAVALLFGGSVAQAQSSRADDETETPEVRSLTLKGVRSVEKDELLESIATDQSRCRGLLFRPFCMASHSSRWWEKHYLDPVELRRDVLRIKVFYYQRGWRDTEVDTLVERRGDDEVAVTFTIREGPPTLTRTVRVLRPDPAVLPDERIARLTQLEAGDPYSVLALDSTLVLLEQEMWDRGYGDARLDTSTVVDTAARTADVTITVDPRWKTVVGDIVVRGNEEVTTRTIRNSLSFRVGDPYRRRDVTLSQRRLYESSLFRRAQILVPPQGDSLKTIEVTVSEAPHHQARTSVGFSTVEFFQAEGRFSRYNFFGGARRLDLNVAVGNLLAPQLNDQGIFRDVVGLVREEDEDTFLRPTWQASAEFTQPWFLSHRNRLGASVFSQRRAAPAVFVETGFGASASATREVMLRFPVSLNYRFELTRVEAGDVYFCINFGVCDDPTIEVLRGRQKLSPLILSGTADRADNPFAPTRGYRASFALEHASGFTVSDFRYNRAFADGTYYIPLGIEGKRVLALHANAGWVRALETTGQAVGLEDELATGIAVLHPRKRFYAGGSRSVRGLGENQLGPRVLTVPPSKLRGVCMADTTRNPTAGELEGCSLSSAAAVERLRDRDFVPRPLGGTTLLGGSVEFRFPLFGKVTGAAFVDGAFVGAGSLREIASGAGALTPGGGIRYMSPVGAIRIDVGFNPTRADDLPVVTEVEIDGRREIVPVSRWRYDPAASKGGIGGFLSRFTLHLSIGEAF